MLAASLRIGINNGGEIYLAPLVMQISSMALGVP